MFFFSQSLESMMRKQKMWTFIEMAVLPNRQAREPPYPHLVQVVTANSISDGVFDYSCHFTCQTFRKGSFLRMVKWEVDVSYPRIIIHEAQYLGGAGCEVKHGKPWDIDKIKCIHKSNVYSKNFVVLLTSNAKVIEPTEDFEEFSLSTLESRLKKNKQALFKDQNVPQKRRVPAWVQAMDEEK